MSNARADVDVPAPQVYAAEAYTALLIVLDVALTELVAVRGPATEVGLGAVQWLAVGGWPTLLAMQAVGAGLVFSVARRIAARDRALGNQIRGLVAGFWLFTVVSNLAVAVQAGVLP